MSEPVLDDEHLEAVRKLADEKATQRAAATVLAMCDWRSDFQGARSGWTIGGDAEAKSHSEFHFGNVCPYEAMNQVLLGGPDPRRTT